MPTLTESVLIQKPATASDGYDGGLHIERDASACSGGTPGHVNTAIYSHTIAGKNLKQFEWNVLGVLDNYADAGENCASYFQGNKHGAGPTWAQVVEVCDKTLENSDTSLVAQEADVWTVGPANGNQIGVDVVVGDAQWIRDGVRYNGPVEGWAGQRIGASGATPWARWQFGSYITDFTLAGLVLNSTADRAIHCKGKYVVGLDMSDADITTPFRFKEGQQIAFENTDSVTLKYQAGRIKFCNGATELFAIDTTTGDIYKRGVKVL